MITYQVEMFTSIIEELKTIIGQHRKEISVFSEDVAPLDPDWGFYRVMESNGRLLTYTARDNKRLVGYYIAFISRHPHYRVVVSDTDIFYLLPEYRGNLTGYKLIVGAETELEKRGVEIIIFSAKMNKPLEKLAERLGHKPLDIKYFREVK